MKVSSSVSSIIILFIIFTDVFGQHNSSSKQSIKANSTAFRSLQNEDLSEDIIYERFFQFFRKYNEEADRQESLGFAERAYTLRVHFPRKLLLSEQQTQQLSDIVYQFYQEATILKNQFKELKALIKEQPGNPNLPTQIIALKNQRYSLWSKYRNFLREAFGNQAFQEFKRFLQQEIAAKFRRTRIVRKEKESSVAESAADWVYVGSDINYNPDTNTIYGFSNTTANNGGGGTGGNYLYDFCSWEEETCAMVKVEATMYDWEDFPITSDFGESCFGEAEIFLYGSSENFETGEYAIDGYHEANYTASSGSCSIEAPDFTDVSGDSISIVIPKVRILLKGNNITNTTQNVIVGQQINLSATVTGGTPSNPQWNIPGTKVANYVVTYTDETSSTSAVVTELTSQDLTQSAINFYWVDGGDSRQVQYSVRINNRTYTGRATFNVKKPTGTISGQILGSVNLSNFNSVYGLWFGKTDPPPPVPGIAFSRSMTIPSGFSGEFQWVQTWVRLRRLKRNNIWYRSQGYGLDSRYPYESGANANDSPGIDIETLDQNVYANESFVMYLMFKPSIRGAIWVPLKKIEWGWRAEAEKVNGVWQIITNPPPNTSPNTFSDPPSDVTAHPVWTQNAKNIPYTRE